MGPAVQAFSRKPLIFASRTFRSPHFRTRPGFFATTIGLTPNRVAALGENVILLANLTWAAVLYVRFIRHRGSFHALERWQARYIPVYTIWAAIVVVAFPPLFNFI